PDHLDDLEELRRTDRFREANELRAFIDVEDGRIVGFGHLGQGHIGATTVRVGPAAIRFPAVHLPDIQPEPEVGPTSVRFPQTVGGRMGLPTPRPVRHKPFVQFWPSIAWTTLALTLDVDGSSSHELVGASPFPPPAASRRPHPTTSPAPPPPPATGSTTTTGSSWRSRRWSTSRPGSTTRSVTGRRGVRPTPRPWSPASSPPSRGSSRRPSCEAGPSRRSGPCRQATCSWSRALPGRTSS